MARYTLYQTGPDNFSTYAECFGGRGMGRKMAAASTIVGLLDAVDAMSHDNWCICKTGESDRRVVNNRSDYYSLPPVRRELKRLRREVV